MSSIRKLLITGLGTGYLPLAPGSWGSAAVCGIFLGVSYAAEGGAQTVVLNAAMLVIAVLASFICVRWGSFTEQCFVKKDARQCTADEWAGQALALLFLPLGADWGDRLIAVGVSFFLFRLFDSIKPPPLRRVEKLPSGWGVLLDDLMAAIYANVAAQLLLRLWLLR